jgi:hypothetical protein
MGASFLSARSVVECDWYRVGCRVSLAERAVTLCSDADHRHAVECCSKHVATSEIPQPLVEKYHAFYEVLLYHVVIEEAHAAPNAANRMIQAGFDVDVHGLSNKDELELPPPADYALGCGLLKKVADSVSQHASECSIELIPFPSTVFSEAREDFRSEAVIRIRILHCRGIDQPAGPAEQHALEEVEKHLQGLGVRRR